MLSAESASNDGVSFPYLYVGLAIMTNPPTGDSITEWVLITILWQCVFGTFLGLVIGTVANYILRFSEKQGYISRSSFIVFYLLLATLAVGCGSTLGSDDFLIAFGAGYGFSRDGYYAERTQDIDLNDVIDLLFNSSMFVYFGAIIPWDEMTFTAKSVTDAWVTGDSGIPQGDMDISKAFINPPLLFAFLVLILLFRRIPVVLALCQMHLIPDIYTFNEALFAGHFGPMGLGALFLAIEARAELEHDTSLPYPEPPNYDQPLTHRQAAVKIIFPVICFVVLGSTLVHGLSVAAISFGVSLRKKPAERAPLLGTEDDGLEGMIHSDDED